jgi:hypothetical protein
MNTKTCLWIGLGALLLSTVCCVGILIGGALTGRGTAGTQTPISPQPSPTSLPTVVSPPPPPPPTVTPFVPPPPPATPPSAPPADSDLQDLVNYANAMQPLLVEAGELVERDGEILEASEENDALLCDGRLAADNVVMGDVLSRVRAIALPADAAVIHELVLRSGDAWTEALDNVDLFCDTGNELYKIPAVLKFWEAGATLQDAANRFWLLLVAKGIEDWVQR